MYRKFAKKIENSSNIVVLSDILLMKKEKFFQKPKPSQTSALWSKTTIQGADFEAKIR